MSNTNIAFVIPHLGSGGAERVVTTLANELSNKYSITVITYRKNLPFYNLDENVELEYCLETLNPSKNVLQAIISNFKLLKELNKILKRKKINVIISFLTSANVLSIISGKLSNSKVIISERNNPKQDKTQRMWKLLRKYLYQYANTLVVQSEYIKSTLSNFIKKENIIILPNPINPELSNKRIQNLNRKKQVLSVGRLTNQKNHEMLIRAFAMAEIGNWQLIIIGEGENRINCEQLITELYLQDKVFLVGRQKDVAKYYNSCAIFAFGSNYEGFPNALIEAMHFGMACISTDCRTGPSELIQNKINGLLIPVNDEQKMAQGLKMLVENQEIRARFGTRAMESVKKLEIKEVVAQWERIIVS